MHKYIIRREVLEKVLEICEMKEIDSQPQQEDTMIVSALKYVNTMVLLLKAFEIIIIGTHLILYRSSWKFLPGEFFFSFFTPALWVNCLSHKNFFVSHVNDYLALL